MTAVDGRPTRNGDVRMAWRAIDPRYLRQPGGHAAGRLLAYVQAGGRDDGHLLLRLDGRGEVAGFELTYARFPGDRELVAQWDRATGLRLGELDTGGGAPGGRPTTGGRPAHGPRPHGSPLVRRYRRPVAADVGLLLGYAERNAEPLAPRHRATVLDALRNGLRDPLDAPDAAP